MIIDKGKYFQLYWKDDFIWFRIFGWGNEMSLKYIKFYVCNRFKRNSIMGKYKGIRNELKILWAYFSLTWKKSGVEDIVSQIKAAGRLLE
jgi:hypothetical protein